MTLVLKYLLFVFFLFSSAKDVVGQEKHQFSATPLDTDKVITYSGENARKVDALLGLHVGKYLGKLQRQEQKLKTKLLKRDSALARQLFHGVDDKYEALANVTQNVSASGMVYSGRLDSLTTLLNFLKIGKPGHPELRKSLSQLSSLQNKLEQTEKIRSFLAERKRQLGEGFSRLGMLKSLKGFQKQAYYYSQRVRACKELWENPSRLEQKVLEVLSQTEAFQAFFRRNSQLASLFSLPGDNASTLSLQGLQTRSSVQQGLQDRFGAEPGTQQLLQENLQEAQEQLSALKNRLSRYSSGTYGNTDGDIDMPEGFRPNRQKTKTFFERLEYGINFQNQKARGYFPTTSDLGLSLGYQLNDNSSIGIGAAYKLGWGRGWDRIRFTHEGIGLRSYLDLKLKGGLYLSGGYEQAYRTGFQRIQQLQNLRAWQQSGLIGLSKRYQLRKKSMGDMKLLWDFLSYQQVPRTQALLFRVSYRLK